MLSRRLFLLLAVVTRIECSEQKPLELIQEAMRRSGLARSQDSHIVATLDGGSPDAQALLGRVGLTEALNSDQSSVKRLSDMCALFGKALIVRGDKDFRNFDYERWVKDSLEFGWPKPQDAAGVAAWEAQIAQRMQGENNEGHVARVLMPAIALNNTRLVYLSTRPTLRALAQRYLGRALDKSRGVAVGQDKDQVALIGLSKDHDWSALPKSFVETSALVGVPATVQEALREQIQARLSRPVSDESVVLFEKYYNPEKP